MLLEAAGLAATLAGTAGAAWAWQRRGLGRWLPTYLAEAPRRRAPQAGEPISLLLCVADHWEPCHGGANARVASARVSRWVEDYPRLFDRFRDHDGRPPRHTFFYPAEEYDPDHLDALAQLCRAGYGEVEVHLHHDQDTAENLRATLVAYRDRLAQRHGLLARRRATGELAYAFVHGNWALCHSRPDGRHCGVANELCILRETGCYADFTFPSAPSVTQPPTINRLYYAVDQPGRTRSHDYGTPLGQGPAPAEGLLLVQGPLLLDWSRRKWGLLPRIENACLQGSQPPSLSRLHLWLRARIQVPARPDWFFVKLHAHGTQEDTVDTLLGPPMVRFHEALAEYQRTTPNFSFHYLTAREMYNLAQAAEAGWTGSVAEARDRELVWEAAPEARPLLPGRLER
jgi:hypothetical protein